MKLLNKLKEFIFDLFNGFENNREFRKWKKKADLLHEKTGYQFHVVPFTKDRLILVNNKGYAEKDVCISLDSFNKAIKGRGKQVKFIDILKIAYYSTPQKGIIR